MNDNNKKYDYILTNCRQLNQYIKFLIIKYTKNISILITYLFYLHLFILNLKHISMSMSNFKQDWTFTQFHCNYANKKNSNVPNKKVQQLMLQYVKKNAKKGNLKTIIDTIDEFCSLNWMMNIGPQKGKILQEILSKQTIKNVLQLGGYCGYSSLVFSNATTGNIHSIQISVQYANIAKQIQDFAEVKQRNHISIGTVNSLKKEIQETGPYDAILIDHSKSQYLLDFLLLEEYGVIKQGCLVLADNIIYPGAKQYLQYLKSRKDYESVLYHSFVEYSNIPDALLVSRKA